MPIWCFLNVRDWCIFSFSWPTSKFWRWKKPKNFARSFLLASPRVSERSCHWNAPNLSKLFSALSRIPGTSLWWKYLSREIFVSLSTLTTQNIFFRKENRCWFTAEKKFEKDWGFSRLQAYFVFFSPWNM